MLGTRRTAPLRTILVNSLKHIEDLDRAIDDLYGQEFQDLKQFSEGLKCLSEFTCSEGEKDVNRKKNRYKDILPFNLSRVVLREDNGVAGSNYVNANYIRGASGSPAYIASQGPLPNTVNEFWKMVVECQVQVIVMACNAEESGKHKCENYWVEQEGEERVFGMIEIRLLKAKVICPDFLVRTMRIRYTNDCDHVEERTICQFHYSAWPDHGVPPLVRPLLDMVRLVRDTQASETLPVLVHCSAGCGRTGTICAIDFVWGLLRLGKLTEDFSLFNLVRDMRKQRVAMVQTKEQYVLVHHAVRELFKEQLHLIDSHTYANVDVIAKPVYTEKVEPIYETLCLSNSYCDEKQDQNKLDDSYEGNGNFEKIAAPPLPKKKCAAPAYSKQEKEVENLSEKNRLQSMKSADAVDGLPVTISVKRPKIAKLLALFERSTINDEKSTTKTKGNTVSRRHSLGPIRKPFLTEVISLPIDEKKLKTSVELPIKSGGKLKVPKLIAASVVTARPVPHVKRSKSLKMTKDSSPLLKLLQYSSVDELVDDSPEPLHRKLEPVSCKNGLLAKTFDSSKTEELPIQEYNRRRRSLDSLMGEDTPEITWPSVVAPGEKLVKPTSPQEVEVTKQKPGLSFRQHFQLLTNASQRRMSSFASGLGIRERRNSFRQAVSKEDCHERITGFGSEGRFVPVPEDATVLVDGTKDSRETLTVKSQNGEVLRGGYTRNQPIKNREHGAVLRLYSQPIPHKSLGNSSYSEFKETRITSQSLRLTPKNRFLSKLKIELQNQNNISDEELQESRNTHRQLTAPQDVNSISHESAYKNKLWSNAVISNVSSRNEAKARQPYFLAAKGSKTMPQSGTSGTSIDSGEKARYSMPIASRSQAFNLPNVPLSPVLNSTRQDAVEKPRRKTQHSISPPQDQNSVSHESTYINQSRSTTANGSFSTEIKGRVPNFFAAKGSKRLTQSGNSVAYNDLGDVTSYSVSKAPLSPVLYPQRYDKSRRKTQPSVSRDNLYVVHHDKFTTDTNGFLKPGKASPMSSTSSDNISDCVKNKSIARNRDESGLRNSEHSRRNIERLISLGDKSVQDHGSESSSSSGARELHAVMRLKADFESQQGNTLWSQPGRSKSTPQAGEIVKPTAPPRVRRRGSEIVSRHSLHDPFDGHTPMWSLPRALSNDAQYWNGAFGVDLDAVAASIQRQKEGGQNASSDTDGAVSFETEQIPLNQTVARKHQYL